MSRFAVRWIFLLDSDYRYNVGRHLPAHWREGSAFLDRKGHRRLEIHSNGDVVVLAGYAWDGCTPKFCIADIVFGIPDDRFAPKWVYFVAVRAFGALFRRFTHWKRSYAGKRTAL